ncbi:MAG TPA: S8 family serine peptidase [Thermoanaerobaculia bacterium]|nr:S8 family serine peptidase [Thermoanaerobaculia bacterium]
MKNLLRSRAGAPRRHAIGALAAILICIVIASKAGAAGRPGWTKLQLNRGAAASLPSAALLHEMGAVRLRDYDTYTVIQVPETAAAAVSRRAAAEGFVPIAHPEWDLVRTPADETIDTRTAHVPSAATMPYAGGEGLFLVQFNAPLDASAKALLHQHNVRSVGYIPYNTALVYGRATDVADLDIEPSVQWTSIYHAAYRARLRSSDALPNEADDYVVQLVKNTTGANSVERYLAAISSERLKITEYGEYRNITVRTRADGLVELGGDPVVVSVTRAGTVSFSGEREAIALSHYPSARLTGEVYQDLTRPYKSANDYRQWLSARGVLDTSAYRIAIADGGMDVPPASTFYNYGRDPHPDLLRADIVRKSYITYTNGTPVPNDYAIDKEGHGTAVAGVAVGDPVASPPSGSFPMTSQLDDGNFFRGMGVAPKTGIYVQKIIQSPYLTSGSERSWANDAYLAGAVVQTHSHNTYNANQGYYTQEAQEYDFAVRDTSDTTTGDTPMTITVSAGNIGGGSSGDSTTAVLSPATAKNVISVGASESWQSTTYAACDTTASRQPNDFIAAGFKNVAGVSRRGTADGRIKPEILAPATLVHTTRSQYKPGSSLLAQMCINTSDGYYITDTGTSFAAPHAAGAAILVHKKRNATRLSPSMVKAILVGNALSMKSGTDRATGLAVAARPNAVQGFGRLYLDDFLYATASTQTFVNSPGEAYLFDSAGDGYNVPIYVKDTTQPVVVVVAWTDEPAQVSIGSSPTLVDDIDLTVTTARFACSGYTGNQINASTEMSSLQTPSTCGAFTFDRKNNVEMVVVPAGTFNAADSNSLIVNLSLITFGSGMGSGHAVPWSLYVRNASLTP